MKIKHLLLAILAMAAVATGCEKDGTSGKASIEISPETLSFEAGASKQSVTVNSNRNWTIDNASSLPEWLTVTKVSDSEASVEVSANAGNDRSQNVVFRIVGVKRTLTVNQKGEKGEAVKGDGTKDKPFTASQAATFTSALAAGETTTETYYVTGTVSKVKEISTSYGNGTFYISDDGTETSTQFYLYRIYSCNGNKFASTDEVKVGDVIVAKGNLMNYKDGTPQIAQGGQLVTINGKVPETVTPDYENAEEKTVAEFIAAANTTTYYKLTGKVSNLASTYLNFDLTDATGSIYVYGATNKTSSTIASGGTVTIAGKYMKYGDKNEVVDAYILSFEAGAAETEEVTGLAVAVSTAGFLLKTDATENNGLVYAYDTKVKHTVAVGDNVTIKGTKTTFNGVPEITGYTFKVNSNGNTVTYPDATEITKDNIASYDNLFGYVKTTGILSISGSYYNIIIGSDTYKGSISFPDSKTVSSALNNKNIDVEGYFVGVSGSSNKFFNILVTTATESAVQPDPVADPEIKDGKLTLVIDDIKAKFSEATIDGKNGYTATVSGFTINLGQAASTTKPVAPTDLLKVYKSSTLSISSSEKKIKGVEFTCSEKYCYDMTVNSDNDTVVKAADKALTLTWSGTAVDTFKCTATGGQLRITKIVITVE